MTMRVQVTAVTVSVLACLSGCGDARGEASAPGAASNLPVITYPEEVNDYPLAGVDGLLELREGCLALGGDVVFWPYGARWDEDAKAVVFHDAPQFEEAAPAQVDVVFSGGGAYYSDDTDFRSWLGDEFAAPIEECQKATDTRDVVYAYPTPSR